VYADDVSKQESKSKDEEFLLHTRMCFSTT